MATGTYSFKGAKAQPPKIFKVVPPGIYNALISTSGSEIRPPKEEGKQPQVTLRFVTSDFLEDDGKPCNVFHQFYLLLTAGKDGFKMFERADGLLAASNAVGKALPDMETIELPDGNGGTHEALNPKQVLDYVKELDGLAVKIQVKVETYEGNRRSKVAAIMPADAAAPAADSGDGKRRRSRG